MFLLPRLLLTLLALHRILFIDIYLHIRKKRDINVPKLIDNEEEILISPLGSLNFVLRPAEIGHL